MWFWFTKRRLASALSLGGLALQAATPVNNAAPINAAVPVNKPAVTKSAPKAKETRAFPNKKVTSPRSTVARRAVRRTIIPLGSTQRVNQATRIEAREGVLKKVANGMDLPIENSAALIPFFEQLYRHQKGDVPGPIRVLHYGDSHTAADELTGSMREQFQQAFGDGGAGYSFAGRPWNGYRRLDVKTGATNGWYSDGLVGRTGDGKYGLGGVSVTAKRAHESVYLVADGQSFELFYLKQPGGGEVAVYDNGALIDQFSTSGDQSEPAYLHYDAEAGQHKLEVETLDAYPVRLFGWVAEKATGVTYETLGINGAEAAMMLGWDAAILRSNIERRNPALIAVAFGTNEAGHRDLTVDGYRDLYLRLIHRLREDAPTATILIVGPPDREGYSRRAGWVAMDTLDTIVEAQRQAALAAGCAFWDQRDKMGGKGAMRQWVQAGMAQYDHVHFTVAGYRMIGSALYRDVMSQYEVFLKARGELAAVSVGTAVEAGQ